jgi:hypothetical protein
VSVRVHKEEVLVRQEVQRGPVCWQRSAKEPSVDTQRSRLPRQAQVSVGSLHHTGRKVQEIKCLLERVAAWVWQD